MVTLSAWCGVFLDFGICMVLRPMNSKMIRSKEQRVLKSTCCLPPFLKVFCWFLLSQSWLCSATAFLLKDGDFRQAQNQFDILNDSMSCGYAAEAMNILFMTSTPKTKWGISLNSGRCVHTVPLRLLDLRNSTMSFSTTFSFSLVPHNSTGESIDGLAFVISPDPYSQQHSDSGYLGLLNSTTDNKPSSRTFAVEFDSFPNREFNDPLQDHVGIDINSMNSTNSTPAGYYSFDCPNENLFNPMVLKDGSIIQAWIEYNSSTQHVAVTISSVLGFKPDVPLLDTKVNLSGIIQEEMYVGFSSSTGNVGGYSYVFAWSFNINKSADSLYPALKQPYPSKDCPSYAGESNLGLILGVTLPCTFVLIAVVLLFLGRWYLYRKKQSIVNQFHDLVEPASFVDNDRPKKYSFKELSVATKGFSTEQLIGSGVFGSVYKGYMSGSCFSIVAIRRIAVNMTQGDQDRAAQLKAMGYLVHCNLVQLLGWCHEKGELLLVYEYMSNGGLDQLIFRRNNGFLLSWKQRLHILTGVASALVYLHEEWQQVLVHRCVKASNVLLDADFNAKLGDFGLSTLHERCQETQSGKLSGTMRCPAPEATQGKFTAKSDVYNFGSVALEVVAGRRPVDMKRPTEENVLVTWVWDLFEEDKAKLLDAVDTRLVEGLDIDNVSKNEMLTVLQIGLLCSHPDPDLRPTMRHVLQMLKDEAPLPSISIPHPRPRQVSFDFLSDQEQSVELGIIESSEEIALIAQFQDETSFADSMDFSFSR